jgi:predicted nuclease of predicted toxin-antitoxin system
MKFLLDESADFPLADALKRLGHDVTAIARDYSHELEDLDVLTIAYEEGRILITNDRDFGELIFRQRLPHSGVILFRLGEESIETKTAWLERVLTQYANQLTNFLVITDRGVRVRRTRK